MIKWIFAALLIVNLVVFLWPAGNKAPFFDPATPVAAPAVNAAKMQLLTENMAMDRTSASLPAQAIASNAPTPQPVAPIRAPAPPKLPPQTTATKSAAEVPPAVTASPPPAVQPAPRPDPVPPFAAPAAGPLTDVPEQAVVAAGAQTAGGSVQPIARPAMAAPAKPPVPVGTPGSAAPLTVNQAADPPAPVEDREIAAIAPGVCLRVGPILDDAAMQRASELLTNAGAGFRERTVSAREVRTWRVFIGPLANNEAIAATERKLAAAGIVDRYVAREPDGTRIVSLGVFSASKTATNLKTGLADRSIDASVRPEIRKLRPTRWLEVLAPGLPEAAANGLKTRGIDGTRARIKPIECLAAAG